MKRMLTIVALALVAALPFEAGAKADGTPPYDELIVFGASMLDNGNAYAITEGGYALPPNYLGRFSNGPVWAELLAENLGLGTPTEAAPFPAPAYGPDAGTNYAVAGASSGYLVSHLGVRDMGVQVDDFFKDGRTLDGDELILVQGGGNESSAVIAARNVLTHIARLAAAGGHYFLVNNHFRGSQSPAVTNDVWADKYVAEYGELLSAGLDVIEANYDVTIYRFDMVALHDDMIAHPGDYGLTNVTDALKPLVLNENVPSDADGYMYWDGLHFAKRSHEIFAEAATNLVLD